MKWNYDLEAIPRGYPVMIQTKVGSSLIATVAVQDRPTGGSDHLHGGF